MESAPYPLDPPTVEGEAGWIKPSASSSSQGRRRRPDFPFFPSRWPFFYGWVIVALGTLGVIASIPAQTLGVGVFTEVLIEVLGLSRVQLSLAYLLAVLFSGFLLPR